MSDEEYLVAKNYVLRLLALRPRSEKEIREKLVVYLDKKKFSQDITDRVISHFKELNYIDDLEFAKWWVDQRSRNSIRGNKIISLELSVKGVSKDVIKLALKDVDNNLEFEKAKQILSKQILKFPKNLDKRIVKKKMQDFLYRRGFAYEVIERTIDEIFQKR